MGTGTDRGNDACASRRPANRAAPIPPEWAPNAKHRELAQTHGLDLELEATAFRGHFDEQPLKSPNGRFTKWLANAANWGRGRTGGKRRGAPVPVSTAAAFAADGDDDFEQLRAMAAAGRGAANG